METLFVSVNLSFSLVRRQYVLDSVFNFTFQKYAIVEIYNLVMERTLEIDPPPMFVII